jgi:phage repressor protein C with HTH and peptisase S24 domain
MNESNQRLRAARERAGFKSARAAAIRHGWNPSTYSSHENGQTTVPVKAAETYAKAFKVSHGWILTGENVGLGESPVMFKITANDALITEQVQKSNIPPDTVLHNARLGGLIEGFTKIPVRGQGMGGRDGALIFDNAEMGDVLAPPALQSVLGAYAVYVVGDSMDNRFRDGEVVYVHPFRRVVKGDDCVIQVQGDNGERLGWIKQFVSRDDKSLKVIQHNPRKTITFDNKSIISVHLIVMSGKP